MAATSQIAPQDRVSAPQPKLRLRYGRLTLALLGLIAVLATVVTGVLAPFTTIGLGLVLTCLGIAVASFVALRLLAVRDRNRKLLARLEAIRQQALQTPAFADASNQVINRGQGEEQVFDARPGSGRRAPSITAEELRAEALRVARGDGGVKQPATWEPTQVPKPKYVAVREASEATRQQVAEQVRPEPLPVAEPLRPSAKISLKASEQARQIASKVSAEDQAALASLDSARAAEPAEQAPAQEAPAAQAPAAEKPAAETGTREQGSEAPKPRLNLDAVLQRRRA